MGIGGCACLRRHWLFSFRRRRRTADQPSGDKRSCASSESRPEIAFAFRKALAPDPADRITFDELIAVLENPEIAEDFGYDAAIHDVENNDDGDPAAGTGKFAFAGLPSVDNAAYGFATGGQGSGSFDARTEIIGGGTEVRGARTEVLRSGIDAANKTEQLRVADNQATEAIDVSSFSRDALRHEWAHPGENSADGAPTQVLPAGGHEKTQVWPGESGGLAASGGPSEDSSTTQIWPGETGGLGVDHEKTQIWPGDERTQVRPEEGTARTQRLPVVNADRTTVYPHPAPGFGLLEPAVWWRASPVCRRHNAASPNGSTCSFSTDLWCTSRWLYICAGGAVVAHPQLGLSAADPGAWYS